MSQMESSNLNFLELYMGIRFEHNFFTIASSWSEIFFGTVILTLNSFWAQIWAN